MALLFDIVEDAIAIASVVLLFAAASILLVNTLVSLKNACLLCPELWL